MAEMTFLKATWEAMKEEMERDETVFLLGEDMYGWAGNYGQYKGLLELFGKERIISTPISESAMMGTVVGAAMTGTRPVMDMRFADIITIAMDEIVNQAAKARFMFGGQTTMPLVLRCPDGITSQVAAQHSQSLEAWFIHTPGLQIVAPSNPADAKGLLKSAIRSDNPIIYFEHKLLFPISGEVPDGEYLVPIGKASIPKEGTDITIVSYSMTLRKCLEAAKKLEEEGISCEVVDLRTLSPWDKETVLKSVEKTGRLLVAHEAVRQGGVGAEIAAVVAEEGFRFLKAPVARIGAPFVPIPMSPAIEKYCKIFPEDIMEEVKNTVAYK
ncbi:MAG: alpha-ketoacid dehydrogenase subunit beta [Lachnospiraceae bacterium]|nr:alpha-ketoacid dehydrogenase subunit beta [Lachnospiraceae bacterium]